MTCVHCKKEEQPFPAPIVVWVLPGVCRDCALLHAVACLMAAAHQSYAALAGKFSPENAVATLERAFTFYEHLVRTQNFVPANELAQRLLQRQGGAEPPLPKLWTPRDPLN